MAQPGDFGFNLLHPLHGFPSTAPHPWLTLAVLKLRICPLSGSDHSGPYGRDQSTQATGTAGFIPAFFSSEVLRKEKQPFRLPIPSFHSKPKHTSSSQLLVRTASKEPEAVEDTHSDMELSGPWVFGNAALGVSYQQAPRQKDLRNKKESNKK